MAAVFFDEALDLNGRRPEGSPGGGEFDIGRGRFSAGGTGGLDAAVRFPRFGEDAADEARKRERREPDEEPQREQSLWRKAAQWVDDETADGIGDEDVAFPNEIGVDEANAEENHLAAEEQAAGALRLLAEQEDAGSEEHGKERDHLFVEEEKAEDPGGVVRSGEAAGDGGNESSRAGEGKRDVHREDAEEGQAADEIEGCDALGGGVHASRYTG